MNNLHVIWELVICWLPPLLTNTSSQPLSLIVGGRSNDLAYAKKKVYVCVVEPHYIKTVRTKLYVCYGRTHSKHLFQQLKLRKLTEMFIIPQTRRTNVGALKKFVEKFAFHFLGMFSRLFHSLPIAVPTARLETKTGFMLHTLLSRVQNVSAAAAACQFAPHTWLVYRWKGQLV